MTSGEDRLLAIWARPRVRSGAQALAALRRWPDGFEPTDRVADFRARLDDPRLRIVPGPFADAGHPVTDEHSECLVWMSVAETDLHEVGVTLRNLCVRYGLVLFDVSENRVVVPSSTRASPWPRPVEPRVAALREVLSGEGPLSPLAAAMADALINPARPQTLEEARDYVRSHPVGAIDLSEIRPESVPLPFPAPRSLDYATMPHRVPRRNREAVQRTRVDELRDRRPTRRRAAAHQLMSWPPSPEIDEALGNCLIEDTDPYTQAACALALAVREAGEPEAIHRTAEALLMLPVESMEPWERSAVSISVLASAVVAARSDDPVQCDRVRGYLARLEAVPSQAEAAREIRDGLDVGCPAGDGHAAL